MSQATKSDTGPIKTPSGAESPTTRAEFTMDSDNEEGTAGETAAAHKPADATAAVPPPQPPRPLSPQQQAENTLKEAFPSIDAAVVKAVLVASGGRVEPAFNALLGMSDPDAASKEPVPPPQPPRPQQGPVSQLEADERYARRLAEHYGASSAYAERGAGHRGAGFARDAQERRAMRANYNEEERNFFDDELPIIKENLKKGFLETQNTVNGWINTLKKKIDGDDDETSSSPRFGMGGGSGRRSNDGRRSGDLSRYDADPAVLGDDFAGIQLHDDGSARRSARPLANPDLFKPTPSTPKSPNNRRVAFQEQTEQIELYDTSPKLPAQETGVTSKPSKWQPLSTVEPSPVGDPDNDPFSLGDSEDEKESKERVGGKEVKQDDAERLKKAAAEAMADNLVEVPSQRPEPAETVGTQDKVAQELATK